jgi:hypothetical protein
MSKPAPHRWTPLFFFDFFFVQQLFYEQEHTEGYYLERCFCNPYLFVFDKHINLRVHYSGGWVIRAWFGTVVKLFARLRPKNSYYLILWNRAVKILAVLTRAHIPQIWHNLWKSQGRWSVVISACQSPKHGSYRVYQSNANSFHAKIVDQVHTKVWGKTFSHLLWTILWLLWNPLSFSRYSRPASIGKTTKAAGLHAKLEMRTSLMRFFTNLATNVQCTLISDNGFYKSHKRL